MDARGFSDGLRRRRPLTACAVKGRLLAAVGYGLFAAAVASALAGCATQAEQRFAAADAEAIACYIRLAQPAVEAYCAAVDSAGGTAAAGQLRTDTRLLAATIAANQVARLRALRAEERIVGRAREAVETAAAIIAVIQARKERGSDGATTQP